jgi:transposase InsO family protein
MSEEVLSALSKLYYNAKTGFVSPQQLYLKLKPQFPSLKLKQVKEFVDQQLTSQVTQRNTEPKVYSSVVAPAIRSFYQMDLMIYDRFEYHQYKYILVVVDIHSRYAMARALTNRTLPNLMKNIEDIFSKMGMPHNIQCDNEFNKKSFTQFCAQNEIITHFSLPDEMNKNSVVERLNRTIADILQRWRVATGRHDWYDVLDEVMYNYNHNKHSTIKARPIDVWRGKDTNHQIPVIVKYLFKEGDRVRLARKKEIFDKGDVLTYSKDIYTIREIDGIKVYLNDFSDWVKPYQLKLVKVVKTYHQPELQHESVHQETQSERKLQRALNKEGVEKTEVSLRRSARERKPNQLEDVRYGKIKY